MNPQNPMNPKEEPGPGFQAGSKDLSQFAQLFEKHSADAMALAYSRVRNRADAEEIVQEAFLDAYRGLPKLRDPQKFGGWLRSIIVNHAADWARGRSRREALHREAGKEREFFVVPSDPPEDRASVVTETLADLPDHYREPLTLRHVKGHSYQQISEALSLPMGTVRTRIARGDAMLKEKLSRLIRKGEIQ